MKAVDLKIIDLLLKDALPHYATPGAAGLDLRACVADPVCIQPGETVLIPTGIPIHLADPGLAAMILPRSGLGINADNGGRILHRPPFHLLPGEHA